MNRPLLTYATYKRLVTERGATSASCPSIYSSYTAGAMAKGILWGFWWRLVLDEVGWYSVRDNSRASVADRYLYS